MTHTILPALVLSLTVGVGCDAADSAVQDATLSDAVLSDAVLSDAVLSDAVLSDAIVGDSAIDTGVDAASIPKTFAPPAIWARPLQDYITAGEAGLPEAEQALFLRGIHDLEVFDDTLYLGYGDATYNLGRIQPISFRSFTDPNVESPSAQIEFESRDEHLDGFRVLGDTLVMPGIDAVDDAWLGNVYLKRPGTNWVLRRTVQNGVHVHDVAQFDDALFAVGSGGTPEEWAAGAIHAHLWRSDDDGESWTIPTRVLDIGGDARFTRLLAHQNTLLLFGYLSDNMGQIVTILSGRLGGLGYTHLPEDHPLRTVFVLETDPISDQLALVRGGDIGNPPLVAGIWRLEGDAVEQIQHFVGHTVVDVTQAPNGATLLLAHEGDAWAQTPEVFEATVYSSRDLHDFQVVLSFTASAPISSFALWGDHLFFGDVNGVLWRSEGSTRP